MRIRSLFQVTIEEYKLAGFGVFGGDEASALRQFATLDTDGDNAIDIDEVRELHWYFGRTVDRNSHEEAAGVITSFD